MNIPNYIETPVVDLKTGYFTPEWKLVMQNLMKVLQNGAGDQGLVAPTQNAANITIIQNAVDTTQAFNPFVCQFGTLLYDSTNNVVVVALNNGFGAPQFHNIVTL